MNSRQENKYSMYLAVQNILAKYEPTWRPIKAFGPAVARLDEGVQEVNSLGRSNGTGAGEGKRLARESLCRAVHRLAKSVLAFAYQAGDISLAHSVDHSLSSLLRSRDTDCARQCAVIIEAAEKHGELLADYNVSSEKVASARGLLAAYEAALPLPRTERTAGRNTTVGLEEAMEEVDTLLGERLDNLATTLEEEAPDFVREYEAARLIAGSPRAGEAAPATVPEPAAPSASSAAPGPA